MGARPEEYWHVAQYKVAWFVPYWVCLNWFLLLFVTNTVCSDVCNNYLVLLHSWPLNTEILTSRVRSSMSNSHCFLYFQVHIDGKAIRLWIASGDSESFQLSFMDLNDTFNNETKVSCSGKPLACTVFLRQAVYQMDLKKYKSMLL